MTMYPTVVEIMTDLRNHVESSSTFSDREAFLKILNDVEGNLSNDDNTTKVVRCINLEGKILNLR